MADIDSIVDYMATQGRRPSFGRDKQGDMQVRGFRSRPGAPMHDPSNNLPMSRDSRTPQWNWDRAFRNTVSNDFGAAGTNPGYRSSFPTLEPAIVGDAGDDAGGVAQASAGGGGVSSVPRGQWGASFKPAKRSGWEITSRPELDSIFERYKLRDENGGYKPRPASVGYGWGSAFQKI